MKPNKKTNYKGFTLTELLVVISILAILATIAFLSFNSYSSKARDSVRISTLKSIQKGLAIQYQKAGNYPLPDNYINIEQVSKQGYIGESIVRIINISGKTTDPKTDSLYSYSLDQTGKKIQLTGYLEENDPAIFSMLNSAQAASTTDYTKLHSYTIGDRVGILLDPITKAPINETTTEKTINLSTDTNNYTVVFTNSSTNSGTITGSGTSLLTSISIIQSSCVLGNSVVTSGQQITAYNSSSVEYNQTCSSIQRTCKDSVLDGSIDYSYDTCSPKEPLNCTSTTYSGYSIPVINHNTTNPTITKEIIGGIADISGSCTNGVISYGQENINCSTNYVLDNLQCMEDICTGSAPEFSITNGTQKYNIPWLHSTTPKDCSYICQAGYYYNNTNLCIPASIGNIVPTEGLSSQTPCSDNSTFQDTTGQTSCKTVQSGYYSTPIGTNPKTGETQCEANSYCIDGIKTSCPVNYSSSVGSTSINDCIPDTQIATCGGTIPVNSTATIPTTYTQTWNGGAWTPITNWGENQATCDFNCNTNYVYNSINNTCDPINYTVTFNANGGGTPSPATKVIPYNTAIGTLATTSRAGYTFNGWFTATTGGTKITTATIITGAVTYYAQWTKIITCHYNLILGGTTNIVWAYNATYNVFSITINSTIIYANIPGNLTSYGIYSRGAYVQSITAVGQTRNYYQLCR